MDAALIIAIIGVGLSVASLTWQAATFALSGSRVRVEMRFGGIHQGGAGLTHAPIRNGQIEHLSDLERSQGFTQERLVVVARNIGRLPVTVTGYEVELPGGSAYSTTMPERWEAELPHRLEPGAQVMWTLPYTDVRAALYALSAENWTVRMRVSLGTGKRVTSQRARVHRVTDADLPLN